MNSLLELLTQMKSHAERERSAVRSLEPRKLFELATEGEALALRLGQLLSATPTVSPEVLKQAAEVRAMSRANAEIVRRSLDVIRAVKTKAPHLGATDAPAFVSTVV
ncbi:MAG: hypothetical protein JNK82_44525 [Myxococcaceae bacterium]|nr:hypothetical protein [Myxococcaceae bacterium]